MKFEVAKEYIQYFTDISNHFFKIMKGEVSDFDYQEEKMKSLEDAFWKELRLNICTTEEDKLLRDAYCTLFKNNYNQCIRIFKEKSFDLTDFLPFPDSLLLPTLYSQIQDNLKTIRAVIDSLLYVLFYDKMRESTKREIRKKKINYQSPLQSKDVEVFFNFEFIQIQLEELEENISKLRYLKNLQDNYFRLKKDCQIDNPKSPYFGIVHPDMIAWIWKQECKIKNDIKEQVKDNPYPYETIDGTFHWDEELNFQIKDYNGEIAYEGSLGETINYIQSYFQKKYFPDEEPTQSYIKAQEYTLEVAKMVGNHFYDNCRNLLAKSLKSRIEQNKVREIEKQFIQKLEDIKNNNQIEYAEAYRQICSVEFDIKKYQKENWSSGIGDFYVSYDLYDADELCTLLKFRYEKLKNIRQKKTKEDINKTTNILNHMVINSSGDGNLINAGDKNRIRNTVTINKSNIELLKETLQSSGIEENDIEELECILIEEPQCVGGKFGLKVNEWIKKMFNKAVDGSWQIGVGAAGTLLAESIMKYYGQ